MLSLHTSPIQQAGAGDAGGMNVYIRSLATALARNGTDVEIFTRAESTGQPEIEELSPGVRLRHISAGPQTQLPKEELPAHVSSLAAAMNRIRILLAAGHFDAIHSHYWVSGVAGLLMSDHWEIPIVHSMHTMAKVKNRYLGPADKPEPMARVAGEQRIVKHADRLIANTKTELLELEQLYDADPERIDVVAPGVDLEVFNPAFRTGSRGRVGVEPDTFSVLFAGRIQRLKGPQVLIEAAAKLKRRRPELPLTVNILGAPSGSGELDLPALIGKLGLQDVVTVRDPVEPVRLADWYRSADVVAMPSFSESFGLVALEAQACGTPVVATDVGGLADAISGGRTGLLLADLSPGRWADALENLYDDGTTRRAMGLAGSIHAQGFGWGRTAELTAASYELAARHQR